MANSDIIKIGFDYRASLEQFEKETNGVFDGISDKAGKQKITIQLDAKDDKVIDKIKELQKLKLDKFTFEFGNSGLKEQLQTFDKLENKINEIISLSKGIDLSFNTKNKTEAYNQLKKYADAFKEYYGNEEAMATNAGAKAGYAYYKAYEEALRKGVAQSKLEKVTVDFDVNDSIFSKERIVENRIKEFENFQKYGNADESNLIAEITLLENRLLKFNSAYSQVKANLGDAPITPEITKNIEEYVRLLEIAESRAKDAELFGYSSEDINSDKDLANMYLDFAKEDATAENKKYIESLKQEETQAIATAEAEQKLAEAQKETVSNTSNSNNSQIEELKSDIQEVKTELGDVKDRISSIESNGFENVRDDVEKTKESVKELNSEFAEMKSNLSSTPQESNISSGSTASVIDNQIKKQNEYNDLVAVGYDRIQKMKKISESGTTGSNSVYDLLRLNHKAWDEVKANNFFNKIPEEGLKRYTKILEVVEKIVQEMVQASGLTEEQIVSQLKNIKTAQGGNFKLNGADSGWTHFATYSNGQKDSMQKVNGITYKVYAAFDDIKDLNQNVVSSIMNELTKAGFKGRLKTTSGSTSFGDKLNGLAITDQMVVHGSTKKDQEIAYNTLKNMGLKLSYLGGGIDTPDGSFSQTLASGEINKYIQGLEKEATVARDTAKAEQQLADARKESSTASQDQTKDAFPDKDISTSVESATNSIKEENNVLEQNTQKVKENTQAKEQNANANLNKYDKRLDSYNGKVDKYQATIDRFNDGGWTSKTYLENVQAVRDAVKQYATLLNNIKTNQNGIATDEDIQNLDKYEKKIKDTIATVTNMSAAEKGYSQLAGQKEIDKINKILRENSAMSSEAKAKIKAYKQELISGNPSVSLEKIHGEILKIVNAEELAGRAGRSFFDTLKNSGFHQLAAQMAGMFGFYDVINLGKEGFNVVRELNTALTEMRKVSNETVQSLKNYQATTFDTADAVGTTAKQIQNSTADWMRLGESMNQAAESAKDANVLLNVSEFEGIDEATESLVSMSQAYKDLDKMDIIDVLNNIGNNYSISTDGLATALKDSASALVTANNDLNEAVSLTTAGNAITQDPSKVGAGLRTISLRLVGTEEAKEELSDLGEETDGMITTVSKLRDTIMDATKAASSDGKGFDILDSNGNYKSTYEIMQGLADLYDDIVKKDKELGTNNLILLLETIAGKNRSNIAASILQNGDMLRSVYEDAQNSEGSAEKELNSYLDSIDGKMAQLENRAQEFWFKVIDSETIKNGIDLLSTLLKGATDFVDTVGLLPTIFTGIGAALSFKNVGIDTLVAY